MESRYWSMIKVESEWTPVVECRPWLIPVEIGLKTMWYGCSLTNTLHHIAVPGFSLGRILGKIIPTQVANGKKWDDFISLSLDQNQFSWCLHISHYIFYLHCTNNKDLNGQCRNSLWTNRVGSQAGLVHEENRDKNLISGCISLRSRWNCWQMWDNS
jgi:hypothetical protein